MASGGRRPRIPNAMTRAQLAQQIITRLKAQQEARTEVELVQVANDEGTTDVVPGLPPKMEDGKPVMEDGKPVFRTYGERYAEFDAGMARVWDRAKEMGVEKLVKVMLDAEMEAEEEGG